MSVHDLIPLAYEDPVAGAPDNRHIIFSAPLPQGHYDFIANLPQGGSEALQLEIKKKFGLVGNWRMVETNVLLLKLTNPELHGFKPAGSLMKESGFTTNSIGGPLFYEEGMAKNELSTRTGNIFRKTTYRFNATPDILIKWNALENAFDSPIVDETGLTNHYDFVITFDFNIPKRGSFGGAYRQSVEKRRRGSDRTYVHSRKAFVDVWFITEEK